MPVLSPDQWQRVVEAMAGEAIYPAKLMARELPEAIESLLASLQLQLFPAAAEVVVECECRARGCCKHAAAVAYLVAERLDGDPLEVFSLIFRGASEPVLPQQMYTLRHAELQDTVLFLVPVGPDRKGLSLYEAAFARMHDEEAS